MDGLISQALLAAPDRWNGRPSGTALPVSYNSVEALERLLNGVPCPILVKDRAHRFLLMNDAMCALAGHSREDLLGRTDADFFPAEQAAGYLAVDREIFATGEEREVEEELTAADGTVHVLRTCKRLITLPGPDGDESFIIALVSDVTESRKTEIALRESEEHYRHSVELSTQFPWTADPNGMVLGVAPRWCELTGMTPEETRGRGFADAIHPDELDMVLRTWTHSVQSGETYDVEHRVRAADGSYLWFRAHCAPRRDAEGRIVRWYGTLEEITARKQAEEALREGEERFRRTVELSPLIPWTASPDGMILEADARWYERTGFTLEQTLGTGWADAVHPDDLPETIRQWSYSLRTGEPFSTEYRFRKCDGSFLWAHARATALRDSLGRIIRWYGTLEDIHDRKLGEIALRDSEARHRYTLELSPLVPWAADANGMLIEVGSRWAEKTGMTVEESLGTGFAAALHPEDAGAALGAWQRSVTTGEPLSTDCRHRLLDGSYCWIHVRAAPLRGGDGRITRWYGTVEDIHDRKLAELALRESEMRFRAMADDAPAAIWVSDPSGAGTFISRLWHEMTGMTEAQANGFGWLEAIHPEDRDRVGQTFMAANDRRGRYQAEFRIRRADGSYAWVIDAGRPRFAADGAFLGYVGSITDITDRRAAEAALRESEAFARGVLENSPSCIRVLDRDGHLEFMNNAGYRLLEIENDAAIGRTWAAALPAQYAEEVERTFAAARAGRSGRFHAHRITRAGEVQWLDVVIAPLHGADSQSARMLSIWHDVTETKQAREAAEQAQRKAEAAASQLSSVLESTMDSVVVLNAEWCVTYMNQNAHRLLATLNIQVGTDIWENVPEEREGSFFKNYERVLTEQTPVFFQEYLSSINKWLEVQAYPSAEGISVFFRDITERRIAEEERRSAQEKISYMARHDALTGLPNRFSLRDRLEQELSNSATAVAALCLDLDGFKAVNDTFGHPTGDALLRCVAERLQNCVRGSDLVARFGGDEFAIIQSGVMHGNGLEALAQRVVEALAAPFSLEGHQVAIGTSIGIAVVSSELTTADELLKAADIALYCAKAEGRGSYRFFDASMNRHLQARQAIKVAMRGALARGEFELHYQPLVDLKANRINSFEALLRWHHPERGMISPADFIPIAEETGLIVQIGEWVLQEACRNAAAWPGQIGIAVNLSPAQFRNKALVDAVRGALATSGLAPGRLHLEITESVLLQSSQANIAILRDLRQLGVRISMDDFGTGYSSLGYLRSFEFDKIKLDRSFVSDLPHATECEAIVRAVAGLASGLNIRTTAEGIETGEQLEALRASGYDEGQGYLFGRPVDAAGALLAIERLGTA